MYLQHTHAHTSTYFAMLVPQVLLAQVVNAATHSDYQPVESKNEPVRSASLTVHAMSSSCCPLAEMEITKILKKPYFCKQL